MEGGLWHCIGGSDQDNPQEKEMQNSKVVVWGGLTNSWEKYTFGGFILIFGKTNTIL